MVLTRRYKDLGTDLKGLYKDIKKELQQDKDLSIISETHGSINDVPFNSIIAARASVPRFITGTLREVSVTITGVPDDWLLEVHTGIWFGNLVLPSAGGFLIAGPVGAVAGAGTTMVFAREYGRKLKNRIKELVKKRSDKAYSEEKVETFID